MIWVPIMNLLASTISLILIIKYFYDTQQLYDRMKRRYDNTKIKK